MASNTCKNDWTDALLLALVYITGDGADSAGTFTQSSHAEDDNYTPPANMVINAAGDVHIWVSADGSRYKVVHGDEWQEFSAIDAENVRGP